MVSFLIAFGFLCLQDSGVDTRSVIAILFGIILILTFWCIWTSWRKQEPSNADKPERTTLTFEEDHATRKKKGFKFKREEESDNKSEVDSQPAEPSRLRSMTLSLMELPFKFRRDSSKKGVDEESIDEKE